MVARVTLAEVDAVRMSIDAALELYRTSVVPALHEQGGYQGCYVLTTPEGKAMVLTFWEDEDAAEAGLASGHYHAAGRQVRDVLPLASRPRALRRRRRRPAHRARGERPVMSTIFGAPGRLRARRSRSRARAGARRHRRHGRTQPASSSGSASATPVADPDVRH